MPFFIVLLFMLLDSQIRAEAVSPCLIFYIL